MNKVFLDIETTGLNYNNSDIIEICCLKIGENDDLLHTYLNTKKKIEFGAYNVHKISSEMIKDKPYFKSIIPKFIKFIYNCKIIIHNANFDVKFINNELLKNGYKKLISYCYKIVDTLKISKNLYKNKRNSLDSICKRFKILNKSRTTHNALFDVFLLYKIYCFIYLEINKFKINKKFKNSIFNKIIKNKNLIKIKNKKSDLILNNFFFKILV